MVDDATLRAWFAEQILPHEAALLRFIHRHSRADDDSVDIRQEIYERALKGARHELPQSARAYLFAIARNALIDRARRERVVSFEHMADLDALTLDPDMFATERHFDARDELRRAMEGLERLPPRCREVVRLRKVEGLSIRETADRLGIGHHTVERQLTLGMRALADFMLGGEGRIARAKPAARRWKADR